MWGGSVSAGAAEAARSGKYLTNVVKYTKVGGNILGGVGFGVTAYNVGAKYVNNTDNTSDYRFSCIGNIAWSWVFSIKSSRLGDIDWRRSYIWYLSNCSGR